VRKEETSWASCGSKGVGVNVSVGVFEGELDTVVFGDDLRPVILSQIDILRNLGYRESGGERTG
jgi:hypothetical protein